MKLCVIIPTYNHYKHLPDVLCSLQGYDLPVILVDDGSNKIVQEELVKIVDRHDCCSLYRQKCNEGKGAAVIKGFHIALGENYTHALQVDADGQHDLSVLSRFIQTAQEYPDAVICGQAIYDKSVPLGRKIGRWITHGWVWIETLSFRIKDSMCGVRLYPLGAVAPMFDTEVFGKRMDFDTDILVRLFWRGVPPISIPVLVMYPKDNHSNFHMIKDNWYITKMHTRLFLTMLCRLPSLLKNRPRKIAVEQHWSNVSERGVYYGLKFCAILCRLLGRTGRKIMLAPIVFFFFLTGTVQRQASKQFLERVTGRQPSLWKVYKNFHNFGMRALDVFLAWVRLLSTDVLSVEDKATIETMLSQPRGGLMLIAHHGNVEIVRALIDKDIRSRITILVHTKHAVKYNRIIEEGCGEASINLMQVTQIGPETIISLKDRIEKGEWIVIAGDRVPVQSVGKEANHTVNVPFFGFEAPFPIGPWVLASVLDCPVYAMFCAWGKYKYNVRLEKLADKIKLPRANRTEEAKKYAGRYATMLETECRKAPDQWYNFYDFWRQ